VDGDRIETPLLDHITDIGVAPGQVGVVLIDVLLHPRGDEDIVFPIMHNVGLRGGCEQRPMAAS
jgi:hypothetical protein